MNPTESAGDYLRGLLGARIALREDWVLLFGGHLAWVRRMCDVTKTTPPCDHYSMMWPLELVAADVVGHPSAWVSVLIFPKSEISKVGIQEVLNIWEERGMSPQTELGDRDILIIVGPSAPDWVPRLIEGFLTYIKTGEAVGVLPR